ncbi:ceramide phosphoethanolamine synthase-like [Actinia tenebrosa]|uniref:Ceramide phosphoethanolamine synthase-like n=1 Tax=Actinia tenebrosa TaxID=6105 RepID=A0A6P8IVG9_ACTTE|nr:ceramide phosphoethanolamine synthase-like [Actinia tenebrosa]XP_031570133.1 ceramide phosphoethanolamine synthase-like [Actinia tenebrosa]
MTYVNIASTTINMGGCEESCGFYFIFSLFTFFVWMDLSFFGELADHGSLYNASSAKYMMFPVKTVKLRMQDHTSHYINLPLMELADERMGISSFPGVTPNLISGVHLFAAVVAAKCMISGSLCVRRLGVLLYEIRYQLDILDGVVFRAQTDKKNSYESGFGSFGYLIDAFSDMCGGILMATACTLFLWHFPPVKRVRVVSFGSDFRDQELGRKAILNECSREGEQLVHWNRPAVVVRMVAATVQLIMRSALWDFYLRSYVQLFESRNSNIPKDLQIEVLNYRFTWLVFWLWKVSSADAVIQFTLMAILFDKLWTWVQILISLGFIQLITVVLISQLHLIEVRAYLLV